MISFITAIILGIIIIPILRKLKVGQIERDDGPQSHLKKQGTPTMGGIIMILAMIIVVTGTYIFLIYNNQGDIANKLLPILLLTIGFGLIGFIDDFKKLVLKNTKGLKPSYKMLGLLIISVAYVIYLVYGLKIGTETYIPILKQSITIPIYIYIPFAIIVILATTNAINLTDGIDGLSSSVSAIIITCLTIIGIQYNLTEISIFGSIVIGSVLGFLMFNLHPAKVFMGDTGSLTLGGIIAVFAIIIRKELLIPILCGIFLVENISVMLQVAYFKYTKKKYGEGRRIFKMAPLHHHFQKPGNAGIQALIQKPFNVVPESKIVVRFWLIGIILAVMTIVTLKMR